VRVTFPHFRYFILPVNRQQLPHTCGEPNPGFQIRISPVLWLARCSIHLLAL